VVELDLTHERDSAYDPGKAAAVGPEWQPSPDSRLGKPIDLPLCVPDNRGLVDVVLSMENEALLGELADGLGISLDEAACRAVALSRLVEGVRNTEGTVLIRQPDGSMHYLEID
jgi:hypothetical protein